MIIQQGADRNPWPSAHGLRSLKGRASGSAVRALVDFIPPFGVRQLASAGGVSAPTLSRVIDLLSEDGLVETDDDGTVRHVDWQGVLQRWALDYSVLESNRVSWYLDPRGVQHAVETLRTVSDRYAATGPAAVPVEIAAPPTKSLMMYSDQPAKLADRLQLRPVEAGSNVALLDPHSDVVFSRTRTKDELVVVAVSQLAADLLTGPGRDPSVGEDLLAWMANNEKQWRARP